MLTYLRKLLAYEPAVLAWAVNGGLALLLAFVFHITSTQEAAATTITTALAAVVTLWKAGPAAVPAILGALTTGVTAAGAFGFHPSAQLLATLAAAGSALLPWLMRANLTPLVKLRQQQNHQPEHARITNEDVEAIATRTAQKVRAARRTM